jgi:hypothetical protein
VPARRNAAKQYAACVVGYSWSAPQGKQVLAGDWPAAVFVDEFSVRGIVKFVKQIIFIFLIVFLDL